MNGLSPDRALRATSMPRTSDPYCCSMATSCGKAARTEMSLASPAEMPPRSGATSLSAASWPSRRVAKIGDGLVVVALEAAWGD